MLKICHTQALRDECNIGDGIFESVKELYRKGKTCDHILHTHKAYIYSHTSIELRGVGIHDLGEPATSKLCQSMLNNTINDCNNVITKIDLLKYFIMKEQQSKVTHIMNALLNNIRSPSDQNPHCISTHPHSLLSNQRARRVTSMSPPLPQLHSFYILTKMQNDDRDSRAAILQVELKRKTATLKRAAHRPPRKNPNPQSQILPLKTHLIRVPPIPMLQQQTPCQQHVVHQPARMRLVSTTWKRHYKP